MNTGFQHTDFSCTKLSYAIYQEMGSEALFATFLVIFNTKVKLNTNHYNFYTILNQELRLSPIELRNTLTTPIISIYALWSTVNKCLGVKKARTPKIELFDLVRESLVVYNALQASRAGKSTGVVTTTRLTHASPSAAYAHRILASYMRKCKIL